MKFSITIVFVFSLSALAANPPRSTLYKNCSDIIHENINKQQTPLPFEEEIAQTCRNIKNKESLECLSTYFPDIKTPKPCGTSSCGPIEDIRGRILECNETN